MTDEPLDLCCEIYEYQISGSLTRIPSFSLMAEWKLKPAMVQAYAG